MRVERQELKLRCRGVPTVYNLIAGILRKSYLLTVYKFGTTVKTDCRAKGPITEINPTHLVGLHRSQQTQRLQWFSSLGTGVDGAGVTVTVRLEPLPLHLADQPARLFPLSADWSAQVNRVVRGKKQEKSRCAGKTEVCGRGEGDAVGAAGVAAYSSTTIASAAAVIDIAAATAFVAAALALVVTTVAAATAAAALATAVEEYALTKHRYARHSAAPQSTAKHRIVARTAVALE